MRGLEASQIGGRVGTDGNEADDFGRVRQIETGIEILTEALRLDPAAPSVARIFDDGGADLELGVGEFGNGVRRARVEPRKIRHFVIGGSEPVVVRLGNFLHDGLALGTKPVLTDPEQLPVRNGIVFGKGDLLGDVLHGYGANLILHGNSHGFGLGHEVRGTVGLCCIDRDSGRNRECKPQDR